MATIAVTMLRGGLWIAGARAITNALGFVSTIWLARLLMPADFGLVALGTSILAIVSAITALPLSEALIQHKDPTPNHFHTAFSLGLARSTVLAIIMAAGSRPAAAIYNEPRLEGVIYVLAISVLLTGFGNPKRIMLNKQLVFWQDALLAVGQKIVLVITSIAVAVYYRTYWALLVGALASQLAAIFISYTSVPFRPRISFRYSRELWSFSLWLSMGQIVNTLNWRLDQLLIGGFVGRSGLGHYSVGDNLAQLPSREVITPLTQPLYPALSRVVGEPERLRAAYQRTQALVTAAALPAGIGFATIASPLILGVMGAKWAPAIIVAQALSSVFAIQTLGSLVQPLGMAKGETKLLFKRDLQMCCIRIPIIIAGIIAGGLPGLVAARVITGMVATCVNMTIVRRLISLSVRDQLRVNIRTLTSAAIMAGGVVTLRSLLPPMNTYASLFAGIAALIMTGVCLYGGTLLLLWRMWGYPEGAEREVARIVTNLRQRGALKKDDEHE